jgi:hypothetical protein
MRLMFATALIALLSASAAAEEPGTDTPYRNYYKQLAPASEADVDHALRIRLCPKPLHEGEQLPADLAFEIRDGAERFPIAFDAQHCFELPANASWAEHDAVLHKNANMKLQAVIDITGKLPDSTQLSYAQLTASVPAFQRVIASQGMMARMFAPHVKGLEIKFDASSPQSLIVHAADGDHKFTSDAKGEIHLPVDPKLNDARIELSSPPLQIGPDA